MSNYISNVSKYKKYEFWVDNLDDYFGHYVYGFRAYCKRVEFSFWERVLNFLTGYKEKAHKIGTYRSLEAALSVIESYKENME